MNVYLDFYHFSHKAQPLVNTITRGILSERFVGESGFDARRQIREVAGFGSVQFVQFGPEGDEVSGGVSEDFNVFHALSIRAYVYHVI